MKPSDITGSKEDTWESLYWLQRNINSLQIKESTEVQNNLSIAESVKYAALSLSTAYRLQIIHLEKRLENALSVASRITPDIAGDGLKPGSRL